MADPFDGRFKQTNKQTNIIQMELGELGHIREGTWSEIRFLFKTSKIITLSRARNVLSNSETEAV